MEGNGKWWDGWGPYSLLHQFIYTSRQSIRCKSLKVWPIYVPAALIHWRRGDSESLPNEKKKPKNSLIGNLTSGQSIPNSWEWGRRLLVLNASVLKGCETTFCLWHIGRHGAVYFNHSSERAQAACAFWNFFLLRITKCFLLRLMKPSWGICGLRIYSYICATVYLFAKHAICWHTDICWAMQKITEKWAGF